jgi:hypothetical protein
MNFFINLEAAFMADPMAVVGAHYRPVGTRSRTAAKAFCRSALRVCFSPYVINTNSSRESHFVNCENDKREWPAGSRERL